jgi:hypothetical protein
MPKVSRFNSFDELKSASDSPRGRDTALFKEYGMLIEIMQKTYSAHESKQAVAKKNKSEDGQKLS